MGELTEAHPSGSRLTRRRANRLTAASFAIRFDNRMKHDVIDRRSLALHEAVAAKLRAKPALLLDAKETLRRWRSKPGYADHPALVEWADLLDRPLASVIEVMIDASEEGNRRRQSSPFAGILTEEERSEIFRRFAAR